MPVVSQSLINPYDVFAQAESFEASAKLLNQHFHQQQHPGLGVPSVVCRVFAVELYLKCILLLEQTPIPFKHELDVLFAKLSPEAKAAIENHYTQILLEYETEITRTQEYFQDKGAQPFAIDFTTSLTNASKDFQRYRYFFEPNEKGHSSNTTILVILRASRAYIVSLQSTWDTGYPAVMSNAILSRIPYEQDYIAANKPQEEEGKIIAACNILTKCLNYNCSYVFDILFTFSPGQIEKAQAENRNLVPYPADGILECPVCHAKNDVSPARKIVETDFNRPIYITPAAS